MYKRYITVIIFLIILVGCFFLFFDKPTSKELYTKYLNKLEETTNYNDLSTNKELNINIDNEYISNQYHYVITFTSNSNLMDFKALAIPSNSNSGEYYPSFGIFDNENIDLVNNDVKENETKGVNLVVSNRDKLEAFRIYVSYNNYEYYYLLNVGE